MHGASHMELDRCLLDANSAGQTGGALWTEDSSEIDVDECTFRDHIVPIGGAALAASEQSSLVLARSIVAFTQGGAVDRENIQPVIKILAEPAFGDFLS